MKLIQIAENFFDYDDEHGELQKVHEILYIYKLSVNSSDEIARKDNFTDLEKDKVVFIWIDKEKIKKMNLVPKLAKSIIDTEDTKYSIINELR